MVLRAFKVIILRERKEGKVEDRKKIYFCQKGKHIFDIHSLRCGKATEEVSANSMLFNLKASLSENDTSSEGEEKNFGDCKDCR